MKSKQDALTIDASGPSQEQDEFINRQVQDLQKLIEPLVQQALTSTSGGIDSFLTPEVQKKIDAIGLRLMGRLEELGKRCQECWETLIAHGWFLSPDTPIDQLQHLTNSLGENASSRKKDTLRSYFRERIDSIETELSETYPRRRQIFHDAFEAHRAGQYTLSVPVFLSQADGIWSDQFSKNFFQSRKRGDTLRNCKNDPQLQYIATMLNLLDLKEQGKNNPLWASETERDSSFHALNRHQVLHGESVEYATEQNSFKAISLLRCFRGICRRVAQ